MWGGARSTCKSRYTGPDGKLTAMMLQTHMVHTREAATVSGEGSGGEWHSPHRHAARDEQPGTASPRSIEARSACRRFVRLYRCRLGHLSASTRSYSDGAAGRNPS